MESDFPPLPLSGYSAKHSANSSQKRDSASLAANITSSYRGVEVAENGSKIIHKILTRDGDAILEYVDTDSRRSVTRYRWQVSSDRLRENSPFFSALLDPNKFSEGRNFVESKARSKGASTATRDFRSGDETTDESTERLPLVGLNLSRLIGKHRIESLELFLKVLLSVHDVDLNTKLATAILHQPVPVIAGLIEIADLYSSSEVVSDALKFAKYRPSIKGFPSLEVFDSSLLKLSEERLRQIIYIAMFLHHDAIFRIASHALVLIGSARWSDAGIGLNKSARHRWSYFEDGMEEELNFRRQCIMNTITDLQAHFLRAYGALEDDAERNVPQQRHSMMTTPVPPNSRPFQCRWGFGNSKACDSFHLGEMVRFFAMRSKTIFLGSTLIEPGYEHDSEEDSDDEDGAEEGEDLPRKLHEDEKPHHPYEPERTASVASSDILSVTSSLRQIPDYQIDSNHTGCGIRRRILPVLDCIDGFVGNRRAPIGLTDVRMWKLGGLGGQRKNNLDSWRTSALARAERVDIRGAKVVAVCRGIPKSYMDIIKTTKPSAASSNKNGMTVARNATTQPYVTQQSTDEARIFFTAKKRNWES